MCVCNAMHCGALLAGRFLHVALYRLLDLLPHTRAETDTGQRMMYYEYTINLSILSLSLSLSLCVCVCVCVCVCLSLSLSTYLSARRASTGQLPPYLPLIVRDLEKQIRSREMPVCHAVNSASYRRLPWVGERKRSARYVCVRGGRVDHVARTPAP